MEDADTSEGMSPIQQATEDELFDELARRNTGAVLILMKESRQTGLDEYNTVWRGGLALALGLVHRAAVRLEHQIITGGMPVPDNNGA